ncbi:BRCA1-associated RING domain protein 1 isoform X2 [Salmo trutta]|uniref:BRCA1-associated RING domain protein 1 isoform X2 n=1 Tax=Salmo trutta TaxID=8032 RepID=UPI00113173F1|nr:BRCA1-associated RING domain protein 1-like isoform X2 [Salmo trutta]
MDPDLCTDKGWTKTKEAVAHFRKLLLCSKCSKLMNEPVCLGVCEHMLCRSCAGPQAGVGCVVCHSPAWVKDIQINRQLSNITELYGNLDSLLNPTGSDYSGAYLSTSLISPVKLFLNKAQSDKSVLKHKKNFKIWFSPRSRKVRCRVEKPAAVPLPEVGSGTVKAVPRPPETVPESKGKDLSVFNFNSSSQDSGSSSPQRATNYEKKKKATKKTRNGGGGVRKPAAGGGQEPTTHKETKQNNKTQRLEAINQQWGFGGAREGDVREEEEQVTAEEGEHRSSKRVSFQSPATLPATVEPQKEDLPQGNAIILSPSRSILKVVQPGDSVPLSEDQDGPSPHTTPSQLDKISAKQHSKPNEETTTKPDLPSPPKRTPKRFCVEEKNISQSTPKKPKASPGQGRRPAVDRVALPAMHTSPSPAASPRQGRTSTSTRRSREGEQQRGSSPCSPAALGKRSPGRLSQNSPAVVKRNHKGETPLHLAAIKGDVETVTELLDQGADPNLKDNAGWTPLHEACNLGHQGVVEVLVERGGVLLNTPGYKNDSPLHDAVRNGHTGIAMLLLQHGASQSVLNMFGLRPVDYAVSPEMQAILLAASEGPHPVNSPLSLPPSLNKASEGVRREEQVVVLGSKLSQSQQTRLAKLGHLLGGKRADAFSCSVTHVVVPDGPMPTTLSTLLGLLNGCWVLNFSWVEACLQADSWIAESDHEAGVGPQRSRINRHSLLPPLLDGCFFYLMGSFRKPPRDELLQLVREAGGQILTRQPKPDSDVTQTLSAAAYHASPGSDQALCTQYIIYDPQGSYRPPRVRLGKVWSAPSTWVVNCISAFQLLPVPELES